MVTGFDSVPDLADPAANVFDGNLLSYLLAVSRMMTMMVRTCKHLAPYLAPPDIGCEGT